jgi:hypothetical protein
MITQGTPFFGYVSLTNASPGPTSFSIFIEPGAAALGSLPTGARLYVTDIQLSSNDTTQALVTVDIGGTTPTNLARMYLSASQPPGIEAIPAGVGRLIPGVIPRATASAVTLGKTVECTIAGFLSFT